MDLTKFHSETYSYGIHEIFLDFDIKALTGNQKNKTFPNIRSLCLYLDEHSERTIYFTLSQVEDFWIEENKIFVNYNKYEEYCSNIGKTCADKVQGFFTRMIKDYSPEEEQRVRLTASENDIIEILKGYSTEQKKAFIANAKSSGLSFHEDTLISPEDNKDFLEKFAEYMKDPLKKQIVSDNIPMIQVNLLEEYKSFIENNLDRNETFIQNWVDGKTDNDGNDLPKNEEEIKKRSRSRCLIFGLEFINHKSQGELSRKRFDILTRLSEHKNDHVIIELKSPCEEVFEIKEVENKNEGKSTEYHLSGDIARSIPQILGYKNAIENKPEEDEDFQKLGIEKGKVAKCIIIIGKRNIGDPIWEKNYISLNKALANGIEIITYTDLIKKLDTTIKNLKENL